MLLPRQGAYIADKLTQSSALRVEQQKYAELGKLN